jgi:hypothetical protein
VTASTDGGGVGRVFSLQGLFCTGVLTGFVVGYNPSPTEKHYVENTGGLFCRPVLGRISPGNPHETRRIKGESRHSSPSRFLGSCSRAPAVSIPIHSLFLALA